MLVVLTQVPRKADRYEPAALELADHISSRKLPLSGPVFLINAQKNTFSGTPQHGLDELLDETFRIAPDVNGARILTPWRHLKIDPLHGYSSVAAAAGTRPRSRFLSR
jgi:hypothetical protein